MAVKLNEIINEIEKAAPPDAALEYDNPGLCAGNRESIVENILITLDVTEEVIKEAIDSKCQLILSHHPMLFNPADSVSEDIPVGRKICALIRNDIAAYSAHTNLDCVRDGLNDRIMKKLGFDTFRDSEGEIGRIADIEETSLSELAELVKERLDIMSLRYCGDPDWKIKRVGVINGSGAGEAGQLISEGCDAVITGDVRYHEALEAVENGAAVIDAGHFGTEWDIFREKIHDILKDMDVDLTDSKLNHDVFRYS